MPRVKGGNVARKRRKKILKLAKGYYGSKHTLFRTAHEQVMRSLAYAYRDRKQKKRNFRKLWITRINAGARMENISYSKLMYGLKLADVNVNRKVLADLAVNDMPGFVEIVNVAKKALENPTVGKTAVVTKKANPSVVKKAEPKKEEAKKAPTTKVEAKEETPEAKKAEFKTEKSIEENVTVKKKTTTRARVQKTVETVNSTQNVVEKKVISNYTKEELNKLTVADLKKIASEGQINLAGKTLKADIVDAIISNK